MSDLERPSRQEAPGGFTRTMSGWQQVAELRAPGAFQGDGYADAVAASGSTVLVGEDGFDHGKGRVLVYQVGKHCCRLTAELQGSGHAANQEPGVGNVQAISGGEAIVGAPAGGVAYIFGHTASAVDTDCTALKPTGARRLRLRGIGRHFGSHCGGRCGIW